MLLFYLALIESEEDKQKFEALYLRYRDLMYYVANGILHDQFMAEDAVHMAFFKIIHCLDRIDDINCHKTKGFMVIVSRRVSINLYNQRKKESSIAWEEIEYEVLDTSFDETVFSQFEVDAMVDKIESLSPIYRDVLMLHYVHDCSDKEIAKILHIHDAAVRKRIERAKQKLVALLKDEVNGYVVNEQPR